MATLMKLKTFIFGSLLVYQTVNKIHIFIMSQMSHDSGSYTERPVWQISDQHTKPSLPQTQVTYHHIK